MKTLTETQVRLIASAQSWVEPEALRQLFAISNLDGISHVVGFPDLHPGKRTPVGAAFVTQGVIYPQLIGDDVGCGMSLFSTDLSLRSAGLVDEWAGVRFNLEHPWDESVDNILAENGSESTEFDEELGTIGGGNHFAELQVVEEVLNTRAFRKTGLSKARLVLLVHGGSRGLGESIGSVHREGYIANGLADDSSAAATWLRDHEAAVRWAKLNRELIARRFMAALGAEAECLWDGCHNSITRTEADGETAWIHRKGAVDSAAQFVVIPGSRGSLSYVAKPVGDSESHAWSLAHGAGRKWVRSEARLRMRKRFSRHELVQTRLGGRVVCEERDLLYEEAPAAYKNIDVVVQDLVDAGLVSVIATLRPLFTYKTRKQQR